MKYIKYIILIVIFLFLMNFMSQIILSLFGNKKLNEISNDDLSLYNSNEQVYAEIHSFSKKDSLYGIYSISGYAFVETEKNNKEKQIKLLFVSDKNVYSVNTNISTGRGFSFLDTNMKIKDDRIVFKSLFSILKMKNGVYKLYIYDSENKEDYGLLDTKRFYKKIGTDFEQYIPENFIVSLNKDDIEFSEDIKKNVDKYERNSEKIYIDGWVYLKNTSSSQQEIILELIDNQSNSYYYNTNKTIRNDVAFVYKNSLYRESGFSFNITSNIPDNIVDYNLLLKDGNNLYQYGLPRASKIELDEFEYINGDLDLYIEQNQKSQNILEVGGWAYVKGERKTGPIYVGIKNKAGEEIYYKAELFERPDVIQYLSNNRNLLNSGFKANIEVADDDEYYFSSLIVEVNNKYYRNTINMNSKIEFGKNIIMEENNLDLYIEKNQYQNNALVIEGWAYLTDINKTGKVYVGIKDKAGKETYYITEQTERPDVVKHFNNTDLLNSGFKANIELEDNEEHALSSIVIEYDNKYYKRSLNEQQIVELEKEKIIEGNALDLYVEKNEQHNNALSIEGWAYLTDINKTGKVYVGIKDKTGKETYYITEQIERPDVVKHFNNTDLLNSGFKANIKLEDNEEHTLSSIVIEYDNKYYKRSLNEQQIVELEKNKIIEGTVLDLYVEKNEQQNNALFIEGWAYIKDIKKTGPIYIGVKDKAGKETYYVTEQTERPDVVKYFNNADLLKSGFQVKIENNEAFKLSSVIVEYENKYYKTNIE